MNNMLYNNFKEVVLNEIPLLDVRAPIEHVKGAFVNSVNMPILTDEERHAIGVKYKEEGNDKATELGMQLVSGAVKEERIDLWKRFINENPEAILYCFRGGSRSRIAQEWLNEELGRVIPRFEGGYKAFRNYLIQALEPQNIKMNPIILGGYTGAGKTILLKKLENIIDLEGLANHRGSAFGRHATPLPTQINFENNLAYAMIQQQEKGFANIVFEDEGRHVGPSYLPIPFYEYTQTGKLVILEASLEDRVENTLVEYITEAQSEHIAFAGNEELGMESWYEYISSSVKRLKRSLGEVRMKELLGMVDVAYAEQKATGNIEKHKIWIEHFLRDYYDPMYRYQIETNTKEIIFRGTEKEVLDFLNETNRK